MALFEIERNLQSAMNLIKIIKSQTEELSKDDPDYYDINLPIKDAFNQLGFASDSLKIARTNIHRKREQGEK